MNQTISRPVEIFFDTYSPQMAYILGLFASDGSMFINKKGSCYVAFYSTDLELIQLIKNLTGSKNIISIRKRDANWKISYVLQIGSKIVFNKLISLGFTPNKSLTLKFPNIPKEILCNFIRGYFDGDGGVYYGKTNRKDRLGINKHLQMNFRCGNLEFLKMLQKELLESAQISKGSLYFHSGAYSLAYSGQNVIKLYRFLYPDISVPHLQRKRVKLEEGIKIFGTEV